MTGSGNPRWSGGNSEYKDHASFKRARLTVLKNAKGKCDACGVHANVVHHIDGSKKNHKIGNLVALCDKCHRAVHKEEIETVNGRTVKAVRGTSKYKRLYGFSLGEMAVILGCTIPTIYKWLKNPSTLDDTLRRLNEAVSK
jgi:hypothetical protein